MRACQDDARLQLLYSVDVGRGSGVRGLPAPEDENAQGRRADGGWGDLRLLRGGAAARSSGALGSTPFRPPRAPDPHGHSRRTSERAIDGVLRTRGPHIDRQTRRAGCCVCAISWDITMPVRESKIWTAAASRADGMPLSLALGRAAAGPVTSGHARAHARRLSCAARRRRSPPWRDGGTRAAVGGRRQWIRRGRRSGAGAPTAPPWKRVAAEMLASGRAAGGKQC
jgi:hypothetical protein